MGPVKRKIHGLETPHQQHHGRGWVAQWIGQLLNPLRKVHPTLEDHPTSCHFMRFEKSPHII